MRDIAVESVAEVLGLPAPRHFQSDLDLIETLGEGLPLSSLDRVADRLAPSDKAFRFKVISRATVARYQGKGAKATLSAEQGARVARLAKLWTVAVEVWQQPDAARTFLRRPHQLLGGKAPLDVVLASEFGGPIVENLLRGLQYGSAV